MMSLPEFEKKQIVCVFLNLGEKISFSNDNLVVKDSKDRIKLQCTCYRIFMLCVIGSFTVTTGLIQRSHKFAFPIYLMTGSFKVYDKLGSKMQGNVLLRRKQYSYTQLGLAKAIVKNKILNQCQVLSKRRKKDDSLNAAIEKIKAYLQQVDSFSGNLHELLGIEGNVAKLYFKHHFDSITWKGRKPRVKLDYVNSALDIGYSILFNVIESLLDVYGFDVYCGVLHQEFYMRKSLACDLMEPFRVIIDVALRKAINLGQIKEEDFDLINGAYRLNWDCNKKYISIFMEALLNYRKELFSYVQSYYRSFMKEKAPEDYDMFIWEP